MPELLFEIGTEELPAGYIHPALSFLATQLEASLDEARLAHGAISTYGTPRRLVVRALDVGLSQPDREEDVSGPKASIAWNAAGELTKAGLGFLRGRGVDPENAVRVETDKGECIGATVFEKGRSAKEVLPDILQTLIKKTPFQKTMHWQGKSNFARPVRWLLALHGEDVLDLSFAGVKSANHTFGHRFHNPGPHVVGSADAYEACLSGAQVMLAQSDRRELILEQAVKHAQSVSGKLVIDDNLLHEVANLIEYPWPVLGHFDAKFLEMPRELLLSVMREHQRYFAIEDEAGNLLPHFVVVAGSEPEDPAHLAQGNARVLRSRFEDGAFYFESDQKITLEEHRAKLGNVIFQRDLGTLLEKVERITKLALHLAEESGADAALCKDVERCAHLCKADLVAGVVEEFPELQGIMAKRYATSENDNVRQGLEEHYWPLSSSSELPQNKAAVFVGLADRLDTLVGIIGIGRLPKGSADPFGLRRAAVAVVRVCMELDVSLELSQMVRAAVDTHKSDLKEDTATLAIEFIQGRARGVLESLFEGLGRDVAGAVLTADCENLPRLRERTAAIHELKRSDAEGFVKLAAVFKRVNNVLRQAEEKGTQITAGLDAVSANESPEEGALIDGVKALESAQAGGYHARAQALSTLWPTLAAFFDGVMVNHEDPKIRDSRLSLLATIQRSIQDLADFTMIHAEG